jgi:hypothetical protein
MLDLINMKKHVRSECFISVFVSKFFLFLDLEAKFDIKKVEYTRKYS